MEQLVRGFMKFRREVFGKKKDSEQFTPLREEASPPLKAAR